jgi:hypothetical protein
MAFGPKMVGLSHIKKFTTTQVSELNLNKAGMGLVSGGALLIPTAAHAADGAALGAVSIPLVISVLVMFPFLYYANALKKDPLKKNPEQIALDQNLKPIKDKSSGPVGQAKAGKKR